VDELARRETLCTEMMSSAPLTGASHATIMTGTYQTRHTVTDNVGRIPEGLSTLAQVCQSRRLRTAAFVSSINLTSRYLSGIERGPSSLLPPASSVPRPDLTDPGRAWCHPETGQPSQTVDSRPIVA
jgi:hypothetical protein